MANKIIRIATAGPQGPQGPIGPMGPAGPTGSIGTGSFSITGSIELTETLTAKSGSFLYITASTIDVDSDTIRIGGISLSSTGLAELKAAQRDIVELKTRTLISSSAQIESFGYKPDDCCLEFREYTASDDRRYFALNSYATSLSSSHDELSNSHNELGNLVDGLLEATSSYLTVANSTPTLQQVTSVGSTTTSSLTIANTFVSGNLSVEKTSQYPTGTNINGEVLNIKGTTIFETGLSEEDNLIGNVTNVNNTGIYGGTSYFYKKRDNLDAYFFLGGAALLTVNRNSGLYTTTITGCTNFPVLPWDRKINNYFIKNNLVAVTENFNNPEFVGGARHSIFMPPILNAGYSAGEVVQVYNMTSSSLEGERYDPVLLNSGSIYITAFSNLVTAVNTEEKLVTAIGNQNQGIYSGSWNNYTNIVWINTGSYYNMDKSIEVPPGYKAVFEVFHYGTPSSYYNITHPHPNNIAYQYGYKYSGYNTSVTSGIGNETSKVYRLIGVEPL